MSKPPALLSPTRALTFAACGLALLSSANVGHAGFADAMKQKLSDKLAKKAEATVDKATGEHAATETPDTSAATGKSGGGAPAAGTPGAGGTVSAVSTKFDFVPGDSVMFMEDFQQDELGEFPGRWRLVLGTFEVAEMDKERWLRCMSTDGTIRMKLPPMTTLPEFWTLEFDFYATEPMGSALSIRALGGGERWAWEAIYPQGMDLAFRSGEIYSTTRLEGATIPAGRRVLDEAS